MTPKQAAAEKSAAAVSRSKRRNGRLYSKEENNTPIPG